MWSLLFDDILDLVYFILKVSDIKMNVLYPLTHSAHSIPIYISCPKVTSLVPSQYHPHAVQCTGVAGDSVPGRGGVHTVLCSAGYHTAIRR